MSIMMKAIEFNRKAKKMQQIEIPKPSLEDSNVKDGNVLVKVLYSALDTATPDICEQTIVGGFVHDLKADPLLIGYHYAGIVADVSTAAPKSESEADGDTTKSTTLKVGDTVFGHLQYEPTQKQGALAEYIVVSSNDCAKLQPKSSAGGAQQKIEPKVASAASTEAITAYQSLVDLGGMAKGKTVLIVGAGGGVGSAAVGIAKGLGAAQVIAICSTRDVKRVRAFGADVVVDRKEHSNPLKYIERTLGMKHKIDILFDTPTQNSFWSWSVRSLLKPKTGAFVQTIPTFEYMLTSWLASLISSQTFRWVACNSKKENLEHILELMQDGILKIDIDSEFMAKDVNEAMARQMENGKKGRVTIKVDGGW